MKNLQDILAIIGALAFILALAVFDILRAYGAPPVPMERLLRNGLTDAQVTAILATDPNATIHISGSTWRNVAFNTARYNNVTNWLAVIGETNDFARLVVPLSQTNAVLTAENAALRASVTRLTRERDHYYTAYTNATAQITVLQTKITTEIAWLENMKILCDQMAEKYPAQREEIMAVKAQIQSRINALQS